jgi:DnaK suppressor protein
MRRPRDTLARLAAERAAATERVADLERDVAAVAEATAGAPDDEHDAEGPTVGYERARVSFLLSQAKQQLSSIDRALAEVASGAYGQCERCGEPIGEDRLQALPATTHCIRCAASVASSPSGELLSQTLDGRT